MVRNPLRGYQRVDARLRAPDVFCRLADVEPGRCLGRGDLGEPRCQQFSKPVEILLAQFGEERCAEGAHDVTPIPSVL